MSGCCAVEARNQSERKLLWLVLSLNATMFMVEFIAGWLADSSGLLADSLDMLADSAVYGLSLYAVGRSLSHKARSALLNGCLQLSLGLLILVDIGRRIWLGSEPQTEIMTWIALLALLVNTLCFAVLYQFRRGDINLRASWICSRNDMLANVGVLVAAIMVSKLNSSWPDWLIGALIATIVIRSALLIIREAKLALNSDKPLKNKCC
jgi:Co/Zn/Cd efflux system component